MYQHPLIKYPYPLQPGQVVEHKYMLGVPLTLVSGPFKGPTNRDKYIVRTPDGYEESVVGENLKTWWMSI